MHENDKRFVKLLKRFRAGTLPKNSRIKRAIVYDAMLFEETEDGGPGSGNWGHHGRPGQVGGSGAGGGSGSGSGSSGKLTGGGESTSASFKRKSVSERNNRLHSDFSKTANDRAQTMKKLDSMKPGTVMRQNARGYGLYTKQKDGSWTYQSPESDSAVPVTKDQICDYMQAYVDRDTKQLDPSKAIQGIATPKNGEPGRDPEWDARRALANLKHNVGDDYTGTKTSLEEAISNASERRSIEDFRAESGNESAKYTKTDIDENGVIHSAGVPVKGLENGSGVTVINAKDILTPNPDKQVYNTLSEFAVRDKNGNLVLTPEREELHQAIMQETFQNAKPVPKGEQKVFTMLGGGSAAGKGTIQGMMPHLFNQNSPVIDADEYKKRIPEYVDTAFSDKHALAASLAHEESSALAKRAMQTAFANGYNCTLDGTGDGRIEGPGGLRDKIETAQRNGYRVEGVYVTCPTEMAVERNAKRSKTDEYNRLVHEGAVRSIHKKVSAAFPHVAPLMDHVVLYDTNQPKGSQPKKIAECWKGQQIQVYDKKLYQQFLDKADE